MVTNETLSCSVTDTVCVYIHFDRVQALQREKEFLDRRLCSSAKPSDIGYDTLHQCILLRIVVFMWKSFSASIQLNYN